MVWSAPTGLIVGASQASALISCRERRDAAAPSSRDQEPWGVDGTRCSQPPEEQLRDASAATRR